MKNNSSLIYSFILVVGDFLALIAAFSAAYVLRVSIDHRAIAHTIHASTYLELFIVLLPFWILTFALLGLYSNSIQEKRFSEAAKLFIGSFIGLLFVVSYGYATNQIIFPARLVPTYGFTLAFLFLLIFRNSARAIRSKLYQYNIGVTNLLIVGNTKIADELVKDLVNWQVSGYRIVGIVGQKADIKDRFPHLKIFDSFQNAVAKLKASDIHGIVQTQLYPSNQENNYILEFAQANHIAYRFIPGNAELFVGNIAVELFRSSMPVIAVHQTALIGWGRIVKRVSDIVLGGIALIIALPFMLLIAIAVKIFDFHGPIIRKDPRLTRFGNVIKVYKFRTHIKQYDGLTPEQAFAKMGKPELVKIYRDSGDQIANDPRISSIGRILRTSSLDELPQLFNIVRGDISLVGPRALQPHELEKHDKKDLILAVKSGLTGLAQVSGRKDIPVSERRKLDLYYVQNWSFWMDIVIIIKTVRVVLGRIGAK